MKKYEILEHTADLKMRAFGRTKEELFLNMLLGMTNSLRAEIKKQKSKIKKIKIKSLNLSNLLVDFLSEALYLTQINREIYNKIKFKKFTDIKLEVELIGQKVERFSEDIKAVTYHDLDVRQRKDGTWEATVLFDI
ncbi:hypothetical protein AMJ50_00925 [Parcubacteria bacterium DG_74_3]|nr:MAG: hypothetical protein AMJ50_00925 [Parcubacteria bacterium DG_74_3]